MHCTIFSAKWIIINRKKSRTLIPYTVIVYRIHWLFQSRLTMRFIILLARGLITRPDTERNFSIFLLFHFTRLHKAHVVIWHTLWDCWLVWNVHTAGLKLFVFLQGYSIFFSFLILSWYYALYALFNATWNKECC